jgi:transcriptional regulator with XRE-family HTH domain
MRQQKYSAKLVQVLAFTGWTQDHLADLLDVSNNTLNAWVNGHAEPRSAHAELVDEIWHEIVAPYLCELEVRADELERKILKRKIRELPENNTCRPDNILK